MTARTKSKWFQELVAGVNEPITSSNLDAYAGVGSLALLTGDERTEAEDILIDRLARNDGRAAYALADIGCTRALAPLRDRLASAVPANMRVAAALALHRLGDDAGLATLIDVLRTGYWAERLSALSVLGELGGAEVERALEAAFADPESMVRSAAASTLIKLHGLGDFLHSYRDRLGQLRGRLASPLATVRAEALAELHDIFARGERGESPEQLGLTWQADDEQEPVRTFVASLQSAPPWQDEFPLELIESLPDRERAWAVNCLWHFLPIDPRAARAFASLRTDRAIAPLRELLPTARGAVAIEAAAALWRLAEDAAALEQLRAATRQADAALAARARTALGEPA